MGRKGHCTESEYRPLVIVHFGQAHMALFLFVFFFFSLFGVRFLVCACLSLFIFKWLYSNSLRHVRRSLWLIEIGVSQMYHLLSRLSNFSLKIHRFFLDQMLFGVAFTALLYFPTSLQSAFVQYCP